MKKLSRINLKVSDKFKAEVVAECSANRVSISQYVLDLITKDLESKKEL